MKFSVISILLGATFSLAAPAPAAAGSGSGSGISPAAASRVRAAFTQSGVVPTLIPSINPEIEVKVKYGGKAVDLGNTFKITETLLAPSYSLIRAKCDKPSVRYSLFMVDPDVPSPKGAPVVGLRLNYLHWYVSGIEAPSGSGNTVTIYESPTPGSTDLHRYTFLVYREPAGYQPDPVTPQTRVAFDVNAYAAKAGLKLIGGNFFREGLTS